MELLIRMSKKRSKPRTRVPADGEPGKYCMDPISGCGRYLTLDSFHRNKNTADGLKRRCKDCIHEYQSQRWDKRATNEKARLKKRRKAAGVTDAECKMALAHYCETGEVLGLSSDRIEATYDDFFKEEDE